MVHYVPLRTPQLGNERFTTVHERGLVVDSQGANNSCSTQGAAKTNILPNPEVCLAPLAVLPQPLAAPLNNTAQHLRFIATDWRRV